MSAGKHVTYGSCTTGLIKQLPAGFAQMPATLTTHKSEPWLRITAKSKQSKTTCAIIPLTTGSAPPEEITPCLFLASFRSRHGNYVRAVALNDELTYPRQLLRLLRVVFNHADTQHIAGFRPGHWKQIRVQHPVHTDDSMPGFKLTLDIKHTRLKTRTKRTDTDDVQTLPFSLDCLSSPLGDMLAGILREHCTTYDLPDCPTDWQLI